MILLVRDEDPPTVAAAVNAFAVEAGLVPVDLEETAQDPLGMLGVLAGARAMVSTSGSQVVVAGLESLDIAEADEWGSEMSAACESEVLAIDVAADGLVVHVFDGGELDEEIEIALDASGRTRAPALAEFAESEGGRSELEAGVAARTVADLLQGVLGALGAGSPEEESAVMLAFVDPLDEDEEKDPTPRFVVDAVGMASLEGKLGGPVASLHGSVFGVSIAASGEVEGVRLELSGSALSLLMVSEVELGLRTRGAREIEHREVFADALTIADGKIVVELADACLEHVEAEAMSMDPSDLFSSMQRIVSASEAQMLNVVSVNVRGVGTSAGEGVLVLTASARAVTSASSEPMAPGHAEIAVRVTP